MALTGSNQSGFGDCWGIGVYLINFHSRPFSVRQSFYYVAISDLATDCWTSLGAGFGGCYDLGAESADFISLRSKLLGMCVTANKVLFQLSFVAQAVLIVL